MFSQNNIYPDTSSVSTTLKVASGNNLNNAFRNLEPIEAGIAYNQTDSKFYFGSDNAWKVAGDVIGPSTSIDNRVARFDGTTGKTIQSSLVGIDDAGNLTGVGTINGLALPSEFGNVTGPASATDSNIARFDTTTGKLIQNSVVTLDDIGNLNGLGFLNGFPIASGTNTGDVTLAAFGAVPSANGASLAGQVLTLQPANASNPGGVTTSAQDFAGVKTFNTGVKVQNMSVAMVPIYNTPTYFEQNDSQYGTVAPLQITGNGGVNIYPTTWGIQKIGRFVMVNVNTSPDVLLNANGDPIIAPAGSIPVNFRPLVNRQATVIVLDSNVGLGGYVNINPNGSLDWRTTQSGSGFTAPCAIRECSFMYSI